MSGGSVAIRGFNYQKAIIALISIINHDKDNFVIYVENQDDIRYFIQVKGLSLSLKNLISRNIKNKKSENGNTEKSNSILYKNICFDEEDCVYKIVTLDAFKEKSALVECDSYIFGDMKRYSYNDAQIKILTDSLVQEGLDVNIIEKKLNKSYLFFSPFKNDLSVAVTYLKGKMNECGILVDNGSGDVALNEIFRIIDIKSEIAPCSDGSNNPDKKLTNKEFNNIFKTQKSFDYAKIVFDTIKSDFSSDLQIRIQYELPKVAVCHRALYARIKDQLGKFDLSENIQQMIFSLYNQVSNYGVEYVIYAVLVELIAARYLEVSNDNN